MRLNLQKIRRQSAGVQQPRSPIFCLSCPLHFKSSKQRKLLTIELALATLQNPFDADSFVEDLRKFEPVLRDRILNFLITKEPEQLKTRQDREQLADEIRLEMNDALDIDEESENQGITDVYILKMVVA